MTAYQIWRLRRLIDLGDLAIIHTVKTQEGDADRWQIWTLIKEGGSYKSNLRFCLAEAPYLGTAFRKARRSIRRERLEALRKSSA